MHPMTTTQRVVLVGLAVANLSLSDCRHSAAVPPVVSPSSGPGPGHHYGQSSRVFEVYIYADPSNPGKCLADWPVGTLWQGKHQTVVWFSDDGGEYTVDFTKGTHAAPKSPFKSGTFT